MKRATPIAATEVHATTRAEWRRWLRAHHARSAGAWLVSWKKATGQPSVGYDASVEEALCFGWIDSRIVSVDAARSKLWFSPRKPGTGWSRVNKARIARLVADGRMAAAGLAKVAAAKRDGSWSKLDAVEALEVPPDLARALARPAEARRQFEAFPRSAKRAILEWIQQARRPETRARRIAETARRAALGERAVGAPNPR